eukprot:3924820-Prymnesium_polylepis.1
MRGGGGGVSAVASRTLVGEDGGPGRKTTTPSSKATLDGGGAATGGVGGWACRGVEGRGPRAAGRGVTPKVRSLGRSCSRRIEKPRPPEVTTWTHDAAASSGTN